MRILPTCRGCSKELVWKQPYKKGDRPMEKDGSKHDCKKLFGNENNGSKENWKGQGKKYEYEHCSYCKGSNYGYCRKGTKDLETHVKAYHPNGEILYDDDFKMKDSDEDLQGRKEATKVIQDSWTQYPNDDKFISDITIG